MVALVVAPVLGVFAVCTLVAALALFRHRLGSATPFSEWLASVSYTVYLIHPVAVELLVAAFIAAARASLPAGALAAVHPGEFARWAGYTDCLPIGALAGGALGVALLTLLVVYPAAHVVRRLPVLRDIL